MLDPLRCESLSLVRAGLLAIVLCVACGGGEAENDGGAELDAAWLDADADGGPGEVDAGPLPDAGPARELRMTCWEDWIPAGGQIGCNVAVLTPTSETNVDALATRSTSDESVAYFDGTILHGLASGQVTLIATYDGLTAQLDMRVRDWTGNQVIDALDATVKGVDVALAEDGGATAVWVQFDAAYAIDRVYGSSYTPAGGWSAAQPISSTRVFGSHSSAAKVAIGSSRSYATWVQDIFGTTRMLYDVRAPEFDWGTSDTFVQETSSPNSEPAVAVSSTNEVIFAWLQNDGTRKNVFGQASEVAEDVPLEDLTTDANELQLDMARSGRAIACWRQGVNGFEAARAAQYVPDFGWSPALTVSSTSSAIDDPTCAIDDDGNAVVAWRQLINGVYGVMSRQYVPPRGWSPYFETIYDPAGGTAAGAPRVAITTEGNRFAVFAVASDVYASYFTTTWSSPAPIGALAAAGSVPRVATFDRGAVAAFRCGGASSTACAAIHDARTLPSSGWGSTRELGMLVAGGANVAVDANRSGDAAVVWEHGTTDVAVNLFR